MCCFSLLRSISSFVRINHFYVSWHHLQSVRLARLTWIWLLLHYWLIHHTRKSSRWTIRSTKTNKQQLRKHCFGLHWKIAAFVVLPQRYRTVKKILALEIWLIVKYMNTNDVFNINFKSRATLIIPECKKDILNGNQ